jgi:predicted O-linked N-acetylglucosamine transferase (SPINDLY family)
VARPDAKTAKLKAAVESAGGSWREVAKMSEADVAALVREDQVDILVELTGASLASCTANWCITSFMKS